MEDQRTSARIDRRQFLRIASLAGGGIILLGCAPAAVAPTPTAAPKAASANPTAAGAAGPTVAAKPKLSANVKLATAASGIGFHMLSALVAVELFLKEEGITEEMIGFVGGGDVVRGLIEGGTQVGQPTPTAVAIAVEQDQPVRIIAENLPFPTITWVAKADSPLKSMKDIKGKKLGYSRAGSVSQTYAFTVLRAVGLKPDTDVTLVAVGGAPENLIAVRAGIIDVGWVNDPLVSQELMKKDIKILGTAAEYIPDWSENMLSTTVDYAKANGDVLTAYLRAHQKALDYIKSNPDQAAVIWAKGQNIDPEVAKLAMKNYPIQKFTSKINPATLKAITDDMLANAQVKTAPVWAKIVDQSFLPPELRSTL
ncbi:MAG: ABC transporter substrate-binding protein [Dehalococcoidia bacterium]|nr:ABC transporter substrate-binding protein [Dehalococcoidia bacterium]